MKKSKKLSLQSLALVLMSFILVAGVAFGMTGAWFTDKPDAATDGIALGNGVKATITGDFAAACTDDSSHEHEVYMPGCTVNFTGAITAAEDSSEFRIRIKAEATGVEDGKIVMSAITVGEGANAETVALGDGDDWVYLQKTTLKDTESVNYSASVEFVGAQLGNDYVNKPITVTVTIEIVQAAHTTNEASYYAGATAGVVTKTWA